MCYGCHNWLKGEKIMADVKPRDYLIGIIIFSLLITAGVELVTLFNRADTSFVEDTKFSSFNDTFNIRSDAEQSVSDIRDSIITKNLPSPITFISTMFLTAFQALMSLFSSLLFMNAVFTGLSTVFGIPVWATTGIISLVTIVLVFSIIAALLQRDI